MKSETSERIVYDSNGVVVARDRFNWIVYTKAIVGKSAKRSTREANPENIGQERLDNPTYHGNIAAAAIEAANRTKDSKESDDLRSIAKSVIQGQREIFAALRGSV